MKILIPIIGFGTAGGYRVLSELANNWQVAGHEVDFLVDHRSSDPYFPTHANIRRFNKRGQIFDHASKSVKAGFAAAGNAFSIYLGMLRALQRIGSNYDIILANHSLTAIPVALARVGSAKKFYYVQAYEPEYYALDKGKKAKVLMWLSRLSYKLPLRQIVNSPIYIGYRSIRASDWVPPGINEAIFYRRAEPPSFEPARRCTIGVIGRSEPAKGTRYALEAFEQLARTDPNVHLRVAFGNLPQGWSHARAEVIIPKNDHELAAFYRSIDILLAPGTVQLGACHYPVLEAMACGTPVVTTGYLPADRTNSWIVPVGDSESIANAVRGIVSAHPAELQITLEKAHKSVSSFYWGTVANRFSNLLFL